MSFTTTCDQCGYVFENLGDEIAGKRLRCKACNHIFRAPQMEQAAKVEPMEAEIVSEAVGQFEERPNSPVLDQRSAENENSPTGGYAADVDRSVFRKFKPGAKQSTTTASPSASPFVEGGVYIGGLLNKLGVYTRRKVIVKWVDLFGLITGGLVAIRGLINTIVLLLVLLEILQGLAQGESIPPDASFGFGFIITALFIGLSLAILYLVGGCLMAVAAFQEISRSDYNDRWAYRLAGVTSIIYLVLYLLSFALQSVRDSNNFGLTFIQLAIYSVIPIMAIIAWAWRLGVDRTEKYLEIQELRYVQSKKYRS